MHGISLSSAATAHCRCSFASSAMASSCTLPTLPGITFWISNLDTATTSNGAYHHVVGQQESSIRLLLSARCARTGLQVPKMRYGSISMPGFSRKISRTGKTLCWHTIGAAKVTFVRYADAQITDAPTILIHQEARCGNRPLVLFDALGLDYGEERSSVRRPHRISFSHSILAISHDRGHT